MEVTVTVEYGVTEDDDREDVVVKAEVLDIVAILDDVEVLDVVGLDIVELDVAELDVAELDVVELDVVELDVVEPSCAINTVELVGLLDKEELVWPGEKVVLVVLELDVVGFVEELVN